MRATIAQSTAALRAMLAEAGLDCSCDAIQLANEATGRPQAAAPPLVAVQLSATLRNERSSDAGHAALSMDNGTLMAGCFDL